MTISCLLIGVLIFVTSLSDASEPWVNDPLAHLDHLIDHLLYKVPQLIDESVIVSENKLRGTVGKRVTQGWAIVIASFYDIFSDYVLNERSLFNIKGDMRVVYNYMYLFSYGIGFGFPLLLGLPDDTKDCGSQELVNLLDDYQLNQGLTPLLARGAQVDDLRSVINEFQAVIGTELNCIDESENIESQRALNGINNLIAAMKARLDVEERFLSGANRRAFVRKLDSNFTASE